MLQPGDVLDVRVVHRPAAAPQLPQDSSGMVHVEYPSPSALPNHCVVGTYSRMRVPKALISIKRFAQVSSVPMTRGS